MSCSSVGWRIFSGLFILVAVILAGCDAIPVSQHPLSNAENSALDEQLFGQWDVHNDEEKMPEEPAKEAAATADPQPEPQPDPPGPPRLIIGKVADQARTHELVTLQVSDTGDIETRRIPFYTTRVGEQKLVSINLNAPAEMQDFALLRYEFVNANRLLVYLLDSDFIAAAIKKGELTGVVKSKTPSDDPNAVKRRDSIRITATAAELRDFLKKHDKAAFTKKHVLRLQRAEQD